MKTVNNKIRKISKMISFLIILFVMISNIVAQKSFNNTSLNDIKRSIYNDSKADILNAFSVTYDKSSEETMIEDWMKNPSEWIEESSPVFLAVPDNYFDDPVEIESWMVDPGWSLIMAEEVELEDWMTNPDSWNATLAEEVEIENWMIDPCTWFLQNELVQENSDDHNNI